MSTAFPPFIHIGYDRYPGSRVVIRVDRNEAIDWREDDVPFDLMPNILAQMRAGRTIKARWTMWPEGTTRDVEAGLVGFSKAFDEAAQRIREYQP